MLEPRPVYAVALPLPVPAYLVATPGDHPGVSWTTDPDRAHLFSDSARAWRVARELAEPGHPAPHVVRVSN